MKKVIWSAMLTLVLGGNAKADPIPPVPANYIMNTAAPQNAQINIGTATIRGKLTVSTVVISNLSVSSVTAAQFFGGAGGLTGLDANQLTVVSTVPAARLTGAYPGVTGVGTLSSGAWHGNVIGSQYGGTGQNLVTASQGSLPYFGSTGVMAALAPGTAGNVLQSNGSSANPVWTGAPQILGTNVTAIPLANLQSGNLPQTIAVNDASISTVSASKVLGNISGNAANITGTLPQSQLAIGTLSNSIPASSITVTGVTPGVYGGPSYMTQFHVGTDGRLTGADQFNLVVYTTAIAPGSLPAGVTIPAGQVSAGTLANNVIASSVGANGVVSGTYGGPTIAAQLTVGPDGRVTSATQFAIAGVSTTTAFVDVDNNWSHAQTSVSSWTFKNAAVAATGPNGNFVGQSSFTTSGGFFGNGSGLTGIPSTGSIVGVYVLKAGDTMTGQLTNTSTVTVLGNGFSVHGTDLQVLNSGGGLVGIGGAPGVVALKVHGAIELANELRWTTTNTADIGQNSATSPRSVYVGTSFIPVLGSAVAPPYSFLNQSNTGIYDVGVGTIGFTTEGVQRFTVGSSTITANVPISGTAFTGNGAGLTQVAAVTVPASGVLAGTLGSTVIASSVAATGVVAGNYGSSTSAPFYTVAGDGRLTASNAVLITPAASSITSGTLGAAVIASSVAANGVVAGTYGSATQSAQVAIGGDGRVTSASNVTITGASPGGSAGGDLTGTYPNPTLTATQANIKILSGLTTISPAFTTGSSVTVTGASDAAIAIRPAANQAAALDYYNAGTLRFKAGVNTITGGNAYEISDAGNTSRLLVASGGNVGIGSTSPGTLLDVNGAATIRGQETVSSSVTIVNGVADSYQLQAKSGRAFNSTGYGGALLTSNDAAATRLEGSILLHTDASVGNRGLQLYSYDNNAAAFGSVSVPFGSFGIGTASPGTTLDVNGASTVRGQQTVVSSVTILGANTALILGTPTSVTETITAGGTAGRLCMQGDLAGSGANVCFNSPLIGSIRNQINIAASSVTFSNTTGTQKFVLDTTQGFMGIGTASPAYQLDIAGASNPQTINIGLTSVSNAAINSPNAMYFNVDSDVHDTASQGFHFAKDRTGTSGGTEFMTIAPGGSVGIGNTSPGHLLELGSSSTRAILEMSGTSGGSYGFIRMLDPQAGGHTFDITNGDITGALTFEDATTGISPLSLRANGNGVFTYGATASTFTSTNASCFNSTCVGGGTGFNGAGAIGSASAVGITDAVGNAQQLNAKNLLLADSYSGALGRLYIPSGNALFGGNVGIGTTGPGEILEINTPADGIGIALNTTGGLSQQVRFAENGTFKGSIGYDHTFGVMYMNRFGNGSTGLTVDASENVGIGTSSPGTVLDVNGETTVRGSGEALKLSGSGAYINFSAHNNYIGDGPVLISGAAAGDYAIRAGDSLNSQSLLFGIGATEFARLDKSGKFGIGQTVPTTTLNVQHTDATVNSNVSFWNQTFGGGLYLQNPTSTTDALTAIAFGGGANSNAAAGIALDQEVANSKGALAFFTGGSGVSSTVPERMRITSAGNVGIGTASPATKLHCSTCVLTIDGSGTGAIQISAGHQIIVGTNANGGTGTALEVDEANGGALTHFRNSTTGALFRTLNAANVEQGIFADAGNDGTDTNSTLRLTNQGAFKLFWVGNGGKVGVGTETPISKVEIASGTLSVTGSGAGISVYGGDVTAVSYHGDGSQLTGISNTGAFSVSSSVVTSDITGGSGNLGAAVTGSTVAFTCSGTRAIVVDLNAPIGQDGSANVTHMSIYKDGAPMVATESATQGCAAIREPGSSSTLYAPASCHFALTCSAGAHNFYWSIARVAGSGTASAKCASQSACILTVTQNQ